MFGDRAPTPPPPALPDPLPPPPTYATGGVKKPAGNANSVPGFGSTLMTGPQGDPGVNTNVQRKSLLGQ